MLKKKKKISILMPHIRGKIYDFYGDIVLYNLNFSLVKFACTQKI